MTMTIDQFIQTYNGRAVDVDGAYGGQCWDLWSRYAQDVAFWGNAPATPYTHVAIVIADQGSSLLCLTQNPGSTHQASITKNGLLGYLRPKTATATTPSNGIAGTWRINVAKLNVRTQPSTSAQIVAQYSAGQTVNLDGWTTRADGYDWGRYIGASSGQHRYIALGPAGTTNYLKR